MRASTAWFVIVAIGAAAMTWGSLAGREPVPPRPTDLTTPVDAAWYAGVPLDPAAATAAYVARIPADMRARGEAYSDSRLAAFGLRLLTLILATTFLCFTGVAGRARDSASRWFSRPVAVDAAVALTYFVALVLLSLPADIYAGFVRPHRIGFSDQAFTGWLVDYLIDWGVFTCFYVVAVLAVYRVLRRRPSQWVGWAVLIYVVLRALYAVLEPNVIEPLTNDFRPLPEGPQKQMILSMARANGIDDAAVVTGDASRQSRLLNGHVSGFGGTTRISVDDNTLEKTTEPAIRFVMAHEIGHFVLGHNIAWVVTDSIVAAAGFAFVALLLRALLRRFGSRWRMSGSGDIASLPVFWGLFLLWGFVSLPASNAVSRVYEHQADLFGLNASQAPHGLAEFMIHDADTVRLQTTAIEYALFYTHPSDVERIMTAMRWRAAQGSPSAP